MSTDRVDPWLEINTQNLRHNLAEVRARVGEVPVMAVVKCNAYGHGAVGVAEALSTVGVDRFAVVKVAEAVALRESGRVGMLLNFGVFSESEADVIIEAGVSQSVFSNSVELLAAAAQRAGVPAKVHVKVDTGMSRVGVSYGSAIAYIDYVASLSGVEIEGIFTTLTEDVDFDVVQLDRLRRVAEGSAANGVDVGVQHGVSSAGIGNGSGPLLDMVRPGSAIYGFEELPNLRLLPTLVLKTRVVLVKNVSPGDTIGYHRVREVDSEMRLATLPIGYADGYPPNVVNSAEVLIRGRRFPLVGYISANHSLVDVTGSDIQQHDVVVMIGRQGDSEVSMAEVAQHAASTVYRIGTGLSSEMPRVYLP